MLKTILENVERAFEEAILLRLFMYPAFTLFIIIIEKRRGGELRLVDATEVNVRHEDPLKA